MTPAVTLLDKLKLSYQLHQYEHDSSTDSYGDEAQEKLNVESARVFKTLVLEDSSQQLIVAIVPVSAQLNLKKLAKFALNLPSFGTGLFKKKMIRTSRGSARWRSGGRSRRHRFSRRDLGGRCNQRPPPGRGHSYRVAACKLVDLSSRFSSSVNCRLWHN